MINITTEQLQPGVAPEFARLARTPAPFRHRLLAHKIAAGFPSPASDYIEDGLDLNEFLVHNKAASFLFTVSGDSMSGAGILDGDKVIVDRSVNPTHGKIVIAVVNSEPNPMSRLRPRNWPIGAETASALDPVPARS